MSNEIEILNACSNKKGLIRIIGRNGAGKTRLCHSMALFLTEEGYSISFIIQPAFNSLIGCKNEFSKMYKFLDDCISVGIDMVIFDEVEAGLHLSQQEELLGILTSYSERMAIMFTTHSPFMLGDINFGKIIEL